MSVPIKPHNFRLFNQSPNFDYTNNVIEGFSPDTPGYYTRGCGQQLSPSASYDAFGREVTNGFAFYLDPTDLNKSNSNVGGTIEWNGNLFSIEKIQTNEQGLNTDHIVIFAIQHRH